MSPAKSATALQRIMIAGDRAALCTEEAADRTAFLASLASAAADLGVQVADGADGANVIELLKSALRDLFHQAAEAQAAANNASPRDVAGGILHGGRRGEAENALYWIDRGLAKLDELRVFEARQSARRSS